MSDLIEFIGCQQTEFQSLDLYGGGWIFPWATPTCLTESVVGHIFGCKPRKVIPITEGFWCCVAASFLSKGCAKLLAPTSKSVRSDQCRTGASKIRLIPITGRFEPQKSREQSGKQNLHKG